MDNKSLASVISSARDKLGISQRELSRRTGIDNNTVAKIEKGERKKPNTLSLIKLSKELNIDLKLLLELSGYTKEDAIMFENLIKDNPNNIISINKTTEKEVEELNEQIKKVEENIKSIKYSMKHHTDPAFKNMSKEDIKFFDKQYKELLEMNEEILKAYKRRLEVFKNL